MLSLLNVDRTGVIMKLRDTCVLYISFCISQLLFPLFSFHFPLSFLFNFHFSFSVQQYLLSSPPLSLSPSTLLSFLLPFIPPLAISFSHPSTFLPLSTSYEYSHFHTSSSFPSTPLPTPFLYLPSSPFPPPILLFFRSLSLPPSLSFQGHIITTRPPTPPSPIPPTSPRRIHATPKCYYGGQILIAFVKQLTSFFITLRP